VVEILVDLVDSVSVGLVGDEVIGSEDVSWIVVHKGDFSDEFADKLHSYDIYWAACNFVRTVPTAILAVVVSGDSVEEKEVGVFAEGGLSLKPDYSVMNIELADDSLGCSFCYANPVFITFVGDCFVLRAKTQRLTISIVYW